MTNSRRARNRRRILGALVAVGVGIALTGCGASGGSGFADGYSVTAAVNAVAVPAELDEFYVLSTANLTGLQEALEMEDDAEWLRNVMIGRDEDDNPIALSLNVPSQWTYFENAAFPWELTDVTQFADFAAPPHAFTLYVGNDEVAIPDDFVAWESDIKTDLEGEDFAPDLASVGNVIDPVGRPTRIAEKNGTIGLGPSTELVADWLAGKNAFGTHPGITDVAKALDKAQALSAIITPAAPDVMGDAKIDEPFDTVGLGWAMRDGDPRWIVVYQFASASDAGDAQDDLVSAWEEEALNDKAPLFVGSDRSDATITITLEPREGQSGTLLYRYLLDPTNGLMVSVK
ncbi:hypothetical protein ACQUSY_04410 [Microbacterium sp. YY-03]|uniref:hypothetical protein n=1 Tax=Microbacterium sp. YY-03 TaxID=3421636 RepID=UPI003D169B8E